MADAAIDQKLRAMADHRGMKLVRSRKRTPGVGDYGKFGLTDAAGAPLLGIGDAGLTASAEEIEAYLRAGANSDWKTSAESAPAPAKSAAKPKREEAAKPRAKPTPTPKPKPVAPAPKPEPTLELRPAKSADAAALVPLFRQLAKVEIDELAIARNLDAVGKAKGGMVVATLGDLVGCCGWAVVHTVQHGVVGRLTVLLVDAGHRRRGIATALVDGATAALAKAGCARVEAMSDIDVANAHNFFRALKFEQTSYRFAKAIERD